MEDFIIKVGPLNSLNSLYTYLGPAISEFRNRFVHGKFAEVKFDLRNLIYQKINITALTAFLSTSRKIREATGQPIELLFNWEPQIFAFLTDVGFFSISKTLDIFYWDERIVGGFKSGVTNPNSKIIYFSDRSSMGASDKFSLEDLIDYKSFLKQKIMPNFVLRCSEIMTGFQPKLINTVTNSAIELIVNALVHGQDIAMVGLQRSNKRITVSVSDGGIGFKKSIIKTFGQQLSAINHAQALLIGSLIQKKEHGLRLAIEEVLNFENVIIPDDLWVNDGWVILSSFDCELRWQKPNWSRAKSIFDDLETLDPVQSAEAFLGQSSRKINDDEIINGYWKIHDTPLIGTRITFEIPL